MKNFIAICFLMMMLIPPVHAQGTSNELSLITTTYDPAPAEPGKYMTLWLRVQNLATVKATNVSIELIDTYPFSIDPNEESTRTFGEIDISESILVRYKVRVDADAIDGLNELEFRLSSNGLSFFTKSVFIDVESQVVDFAIGSLQSEPESLFSDSEENKLTIGLQNIGEATAKLVRAEIDLPPGFTPSSSYSDTYSVGNIESESSGDVIFYIDIDKDVTEGDHTAEMAIFYKDDVTDQYKEREIDVRIPVRASPLFEIANVTINPVVLGQGMENAELKLDILNSGSREAENVNVRILKEATQPFDFDEKSDFIGNLEPDETGQAVFRFDIDSTADLKKYFMDVEIRYTTNSDVTIVDEKIDFEVTESLPNMTGLYVIGIFILIVVAFFVWYWRK